MARGRKPQGQKAMSRAELLAYQRGYYAGSRNHWPDQIPTPPDELMGPIIAATDDLATAVGGICGALDPTDDWVILMQPKLEALQAAKAKLRDWLTQPPTATQVAQSILSAFQAGGNVIASGIAGQGESCFVTLSNNVTHRFRLGHDYFITPAPTI